LVLIADRDKVVTVQTNAANPMMTNDKPVDRFGLVDFSTGRCPYITYSCLANDPGNSQEKHHTPNVQSH